MSQRVFLHTWACVCVCSELTAQKTVTPILGENDNNFNCIITTYSRANGIPQNSKYLLAFHSDPPSLNLEHSLSQYNLQLTAGSATNNYNSF